VGRGSGRDGALIPVSVLGRGLLATRAKLAVTRNAERGIALVDDPAAARVVILATTEEFAADYLKTANGRPNGRLIYDLSGHSKRSGCAADALDAALFDAEVCQPAGIVAVPACYASSVLIPLVYLQRCGLLAPPYEVHAVCIGGRTTLGASKAIGNGALRLASQASTKVHNDECNAHLPSGARCSLEIFVGDLASGIIASASIAPSLLAPTARLSIRLDPLTLSLVRDTRPQEHDVDAPFDNSHRDQFRFVLFPDEESQGLRMLSYVHNLDLPLAIVYAHARKALGKEWLTQAHTTAIQDYG